MRKFTAVMPR